MTDKDDGEGSSTGQFCMAALVKSESCVENTAPQMEINSDEMQPNLNKLVQNPFQFRCDVCNVNCTGQESYDQHLQGSKHLKKLAQNAIHKDGTSQVQPKDNLESLIKTQNPSQFRCDVCNVDMSGQIQYDMHMQGSKHLKKLAQNPSQFHCDVCNVSCTGKEAYNMHLVGKQHKKKLSSTAMAIA